MNTWLPVAGVALLIATGAAVVLVCIAASRRARR